MKGFATNIEAITLDNNNFRKVVYTAQHSQLVVMSLKPKEDIGMEVHDDTDQFLRFESGHGIVNINGIEHAVISGDALVVPAGARHNVINTSTSGSLKLYTLYSPAHHRDGTVHATKADAEQDSEHFDGRTSEVSVNRDSTNIHKNEVNI